MLEIRLLWYCAIWNVCMVCKFQKKPMENYIYQQTLYVMWQVLQSFQAICSYLLMYDLPSFLQQDHRKVENIRGNLQIWGSSNSAWVVYFTLVKIAISIVKKILLLALGTIFAIWASPDDVWISARCWNGDVIINETSSNNSSFWQYLPLFGPVGQSKADVEPVKPVEKYTHQLIYI